MWRDVATMAHHAVFAVCGNYCSCYYGVELRRVIMGPIGCVLGLVMQIIQSALMIISLPFILIAYLFSAIFGGKK